MVTAFVLTHVDFYNSVVLLCLVRFVLIFVCFVYVFFYIGTKKISFFVNVADTMSLSDLSCGTLQSGHEISGDVHKHGHDNRCWICEEWSPHTFVANKKERKQGITSVVASSGDGGGDGGDGGDGGGDTNSDPPLPLLLTLSFEKWMTFPLRAPSDSSGAVGGSAGSAGSSNNIQLIRMCPPGVVKSMIRRATLDEEYRNVMGSSCAQPTTSDYGMRRVRASRVSKPLIPFYQLHKNELPVTCRPRTLLPDGRLKGDPKWKRSSDKSTSGASGGSKHKSEYGKAPEAPEVAQFLGLREDYARTKLRNVLKKNEDHLGVLLELEPHAVLLRELFQFYAFQGDSGKFEC